MKVILPKPRRAIFLDVECDTCGSETYVVEIKDGKTHQTKVAICYACIVEGGWKEWAAGSTKTLLLVARGRLAELGMA